jgi:hypothetical protein
MTKQLTLAQKILRISRATAAVERGGTNDEERYKYPRVGDVLDVVQPLMWKHKLILTPLDGRDTTPEIKRTDTPKGSIADLIIEWKLEDIVTSEYRIYRIPGSGWSKDDKSSYKAITGSRKQAHVLIFGLRTLDAEYEPEAPHDYPIDREEAVQAAKEVGEKKAEELKRKRLTVEERAEELKEAMRAGK